MSYVIVIGEGDYVNWNAGYGRFSGKLVQWVWGVRKLGREWQREDG